MAHFRKYSMASAIALAFGLTACGGGGGGGMASIPPPPPTPTPAGVVGAAARATVPNANLFPQATVGGPTMQAHSTTVFPLLETVVSIGSAGAVANTAANNGGGTLQSDSTGTSINHHYSLGVPGLGFTDVALVAGGFYCYTFCGRGGGQSISLDIVDPATSNLSWTSYGVWDAYQSSTQTMTLAPFVTGYRTPAGSVPTTGTATYNGLVVGRAMFPEAGALHGVGVYWLDGDAALQANFGSGNITGSLTNMTAGGVPWNSVSLMGAISGGNFSGTSAATSSPAGIASLSGSATGTFAGMFFGPSAQELGAVWTLYDGARSAIGSIGAKSGP
jgi:hypothetical protein